MKKYALSLLSVLAIATPVFAMPIIVPPLVPVVSPVHFPSVNMPKVNMLQAYREFRGFVVNRSIIR